MIKFIILSVVSGAIFLGFTAFMYKPIEAWVKSYFITKKLLKETRSIRRALKGKHMADRLLDIWNNGHPWPLVSIDVLYSKNNFWQGAWWDSTIDKKLEGQGLVERFQENQQMKVRLSENKLTKAVIKRLNKLVDKGEF